MMQLVGRHKEILASILWFVERMCPFHFGRHFALFRTRDTVVALGGRSRVQAPTRPSFRIFRQLHIDVARRSYMSFSST